MKRGTFGGAHGTREIGEAAVIIFRRPRGSLCVEKSILKSVTSVVN